MGRPDEVVECAFLIPLVRDSDRRPHQSSCWNALQDALFERFGGSTGPDLIYRAVRPVRGEYRSESGERVSDESWRYLVAVPRSDLDELRSILRRAANTFDQEAIYLTVAGIVELVTGSDAEGFLL
jgi:hypothetical protein